MILTYYGHFFDKKLIPDIFCFLETMFLVTCEEDQTLYPLILNVEGRHGVIHIQKMKMHLIKNVVYFYYWRGREWKSRLQGVREKLETHLETSPPPSLPPSLGQRVWLGCWEELPDRCCSDF